MPLVRKLNTLGTRVMVLGWDFRYTDANGSERETRTAQTLLDEATYPVMMNTVIEDRARQNEPLVRNLFVPKREIAVPTTRPSAPPYVAVPPPPAPLPSAPPALPAPVFGPPPAAAPTADEPAPEGAVEGTVQNIKNGYGFIIPDQGGAGGNIFFYHLDVDGDFFELRPGDRVRYVPGQNDRGPCARHVRRLRPGPRPAPLTTRPAPAAVPATQPADGDDSGEA
jgi:cold shock CspA family protein